MLPRGLFAGLLVVSLLAQGLPISVCRCALAAAGKANASQEAAAEPICPHCVAKAVEASDRAASVGETRRIEAAFAEPCCGTTSSCPCCLEQSRSRTIVTTAASVVERPASPQALPPTDPFANLSGVSIDGFTLDAVPELPPRLPVRILLCVWRN